MNKLLYIIGIMTVFSCTSCKTNQPLSSKEGANNITALPFGPQAANFNHICSSSSDFYDAIIGKDIQGPSPVYSESFDLPAIEKFNYILVDSLNESDLCYRRFQQNGRLKLSSYKVRLPDLGKLELYYASDVYHSTPDYQAICPSSSYQRYGFLLLFDKENKSANVFCILQDYFVDAYRVRRFFIDQNYTINICDLSYTDGGEGELEETIESKIQINLLEDKVYTINRLGQ